MGLLRKAFAEAEARWILVETDEAKFARNAGIEVTVVPGSAKNLKITQPGDIELAQSFIWHRLRGAR